MKGYELKEFFFYRLLEELVKDKKAVKTGLIVGKDYDIKVTIRKLKKKEIKVGPYLQILEK